MVWNNISNLASFCVNNVFLSLLLTIWTSDLLDCVMFSSEYSVIPVMREDKNLISICGHVGRNIMDHQLLQINPHIGYSWELICLHCNTLNSERMLVQHRLDSWTCARVRILWLNRKQRSSQRGRKAEINWTYLIPWTITMCVRTILKLIRIY